MIAGVQRLLRIGLNVGDLDRACAFYRDALGFRVIENPARPIHEIDWLAADGARAARLVLGRQEIELRQYDALGAPYPSDSTAADLWFQHFAIVTRDMESAYAQLLRHDVTRITMDGPQRLPPETGSVVAYKFRDPEGHPLELIHFPRGGGDFTQPVGSAEPTVGIDHSALSVADAARSIAFYAALGLSLRSQQHNTGPAQDRLDGLSNVSVQVIGMFPVDRPAPHVELLAYDTPRGRPAAPAPSGRDIADSRLIFEARDLTRLLDALAAAGISTLRFAKDGKRIAAAELRDPDGHLIVLLEPA